MFLYFNYQKIDKIINVKNQDIILMLMKKDIFILLWSDLNVGSPQNLFVKILTPKGDGFRRWGL